MARFDVHSVEGSYYLDVQTNLLPSLGTRLVVPLVSTDYPIKAVRRLHPQVEVVGKPLVMATHLMVAVPERSLGQPIASLRGRYDDIVLPSI